MLWWRVEFQGEPLGDTVRGVWGLSVPGGVREEPLLALFGEPVCKFIADIAFVAFDPGPLKTVKRCEECEELPTYAY